MNFKTIMGWLVILAAAILLATPFLAETKMTVVKIYGTTILLVPVASIVCAVKDKFLS